jgi:hypothetical protein
LCPSGFVRRRAWDVACGVARLVSVLRHHCIVSARVILGATLHALSRFIDLSAPQDASSPSAMAQSHYS